VKDVGGVALSLTKWRELTMPYATESVMHKDESVPLSVSVSYR
jgi:hypothetical protein